MSLNSDLRPPNSVIVLGGGFAGLSAATALAEAGVGVSVLEARPSLGGRASAFVDPATGERVDNGQHVLTGAYRETFRFLRRIGTERDVYVQPALRATMIDRDGRQSALVCPAIPAPFHLLAGALRWPAIGWRDRLALLRLRTGGAPGRRPNADPDATVRAWLARHGQTPRLVELLWEPLAVAALNQSIDEGAGEMFGAVLRRMLTRDRRDSSLAIPVKPLDELYALPARDYLRRAGGDVRTGAAARVIVSAGPAPLEVQVRGETLRPPAVVCAVPWHAFGSVIGGHSEPLAPIVAAAAATASSAIVTVNLWLADPVTPAPFVGLPGRAMQWVFDKRHILGERVSHLSLVSSAANALAARGNQEIVDLALREIREALPAARGTAVRRAVVVREKRATFSVAPGQPPRPGVRTAVPGLFLAGDWIETGLPATIESAVTSGHAAAAAVLDHLRRV